MKRYLTQLVQRRDLLFWMAMKDIKVRYKMPVLGLLWAVLVPLLLSLIFWIIFTYVIPVRVEGYPSFFLFLIVGIFPWMFFAQSVSGAMTSIVDAGTLIREVPFPRAIIPFSMVAVNFVHFLVVLLLIMGILLAVGLLAVGSLWLLPLVIVPQLVFTMGIALLLAVLYVRYRDIKYLTEVGLMLWFYLTPIFYPIDLVMQGPAVLQAAYLLNPFVYFLELYRIALLGGASMAMPISPLLMVGVVTVVSAGVFYVGLTMFRRLEPAFAEWT